MSDQIPIEQQQQPQQQNQPPYPTESADVLLSEAGADEDVQISTGHETTAKHLDEEVARLKAVLNSQNPHAPQTDEEKRDIDSRSIYIGNVDYATLPTELQQHFLEAGTVKRVTILMNKFTGQPKGFAYLEFEDIDGVNKAIATLDGSTFRDRELKVTAKRTNIPGVSTTNRGRGGFRGGRGRGGFRGRGRGRGGFRGGSRFTPY